MWQTTYGERGVLRNSMVCPSHPPIPPLHNTHLKLPKPRASMHPKPLVPSLSPKP